MINTRIASVSALLLFLIAEVGVAQAIPEPSIPFNPKHYVCYKASELITIDGSLNEVSWQEAKWTDYFLDIEGKSKPRPRFNTRIKMLWDDRYFYIAAEMEDPDLWATLTRRDTVIFYDNDFEVFIDPDGDTHNYYELELNALGTVWDLFLTKPYRDGAKVLDAWDIRGLKLGVDLQGTLNNPADRDTSWTVEIAIPWLVLEEAANHAGPPDNGEQWRVNFSRVQWETQVENGFYKKKLDPRTGDSLPENNWVWSPQGVINMHYPEMWGFVQFENSEEDIGAKSFEESRQEKLKWMLRKFYYKQRQHMEQHGKYAEQLDHLSGGSILDTFSKDSESLKLTIQAFENTYVIKLFDDQSNETWFINQYGKTWKDNNK